VITPEFGGSPSVIKWAAKPGEGCDQTVAIGARPKYRVAASSDPEGQKRLMVMSSSACPARLLLIITPSQLHG
jgi:hypothetical protein